MWPSDTVGVCRVILFVPQLDIMALYYIFRLAQIKFGLFLKLEDCFFDRLILYL